jgi:glutathione S-transferase
VTTRFTTYDVHIDRICDGYVRTIAKWPLMEEWTAAAANEPDEFEELDVEF